MTPLSFDALVAAGLVTSAVIALFVPIVLAIVVRRRTRASWRALGLGALAFVVSQPVLRLPWQIPLGLALKDRMEASPAWAFGFLVFSSFTAGLFEETARWVAIRFGLKERSTREAVMLGVGHGGIESILLVGLPLVANTVLYTLLANGWTLGMDAPTLAAVSKQFAELTAVTSFLGGYERLLAITFHICLSVVVMQAFRLGGWKWVALAIALHTAGNAIVGEATKAWGAVAGEGILTVFVVGTVLFTLRLARRPGPETPVEATSEPS